MTVLPTMEVTTENVTKSFNAALNRTNDEWGPKRDSLYIVIPITVIYATIFLTGVIGNVSTCIVIAKNKSMHTATNYYLFSLAVSDLLLLVSGLPPEVYLIWSRFPYVFGEAFCVLQGFAAETSANATVLTITAFTIERYVAICHPFLSHTMSKLSRAIKFVIAIWFIAMCLAIPQAMSFGIVFASQDENTDHYVCSIKRIIIPHAFEISTLVFFIAPMSLITVLYVLIGIQLRRTALRGGTTRNGPHSSSVRLKHRQGKSVPGRENGNGVGHTVVIVTPGEEEGEDRVEVCGEEDGRKNFPRNAQHHATRHVVKMLVAVVVAFFVCWAPFHAQRLLAIYGNHQHQTAVAAFRILTYVSGVLYYLSTSINPLLYHIMSHKFREAFKDTFAQCRNCCRNHEREVKNYSTLSGRSSQVNSHSGNTDSQCSRQSSLRYLEPELASRRPLIVSFRKPHCNGINKCRSPRKECMTMDPEIQQSLNNLEELSKEKKSKYLNDKLKVISLMDTEMLSPLSDLCIYRDRSPNGSVDLNIPCFPKNCFNYNGSPRLEVTMDPESLPEIKFKKRFINSDLFDTSNTTLTSLDSKNHYLPSDDLGVEMQNLQPKHICPHKKYPKIEDIEVFHKQTFKIKNKRRHHRHHHRHKVAEKNVLPKSCTFSIDETKSEWNSNDDKQFLGTPRTNRSNSFSCLRTEGNDSVLLVK